jgi:hypothetical protein
VWEILTACLARGIACKYKLVAVVIYQMGLSAMKKIN